MARKIDRIAIVVVSLAVGLQAIVPGWQIMTDGSVYGFKLPVDWLSSYWPFDGYFAAGLVLLVVIGGAASSPRPSTSPISEWVPWWPSPWAW